MKYPAQIISWHASPNMGYAVEWYKDDDFNSGLGDNPQVARWYGSHQECFDILMRGTQPRELGCEWYRKEGER